ncbi:MAG TPA: M14 family zinc carboxypeptidase [Thermoanaerobaculia bacterium]|nr:M14 family zinc carboxypeptidase [Thermoanaerobaculia bacterium]
MPGIARTILCLLALLACLAPTASIAQDADMEKTGHLFVRVYFKDLRTAHRIAASFEPTESRYKQGYLLLEVSFEDYDRLLASGLRVEIDPEAANRYSGLNRSIPSYSCYRTVEETFSSAQALVAANPNLATFSDVGDSWEKSIGRTGYDLKVLKLTNSAIAGPKPRLLLNSGLHAREYAPVELALRFAESLISGYGTDADATWLLDYHEIHLLLQSNPDGRKKAEAGASWRKNVNENYCGATSSSRGADLNRNFAFMWGCCNGSSTNPCNDTYRGPSAASEPEAQALQAYMASIFPDQRGPNLTDAAPATTSGLFLDLHSSGRLVLWPWGMTSSVAPNGTALQTLGRKLAYFNGHSPGQSVGLYPTDGATDDHCYGTLGIASLTFELGTAFFESCTYFTNTLLPANLPALRYAAKVARTPYLTPAGPETVTVSLSAGSAAPGVAAGTNVTLTASVNDSRFNNTNGTEPSQNIAAAEVYVDTPPWGAAPVPIALSAADGAFNSTSETVTASLATAGLGAGRHTLFVRGRDAANNWGAVSAIFLYISGSGGNTAPSVAITAPANGASLASGTAVTFSGTASDSQDGNLASSLAWTSSLDGAIGSGASFQTSALSAGTHTITAAVTDSGGLAGSASISLTVTSGGSVTVTFYSVAAQDGRLWETTETANVGGGGSSTDNTTASLRVGDFSDDTQYRSIVSFDTSALPDTATITAATLRLKRGTLSGTSPFTTHGTCTVDMSSAFGGSAAFAAGDFEAAATAAGVASMSSPAANGAFSTGSLNASGRAAVNKTGTTQFRVFMTTEDNDDLGSDYIGFYSGEAAAGNQPELVITYTP